MQFGAAILTGVLLAKSGLPTVWISLYESLVFFSSLACFFWVAGGQNALLQLYPGWEDSLRERASALFSVALLFLLAGLVTALIAFGFRHTLAGLISGGDALPLMDLIALYLALNAPTFIIHILYLLLGRYRSIVIYGAVSYTLQVVLVLVPVLSGHGLRAVWWGMTAWAAFKFCWGVALVARHTSCRWNSRFICRLAPLALPLVLFSLIGKGTEYASGLMVANLIEDDKAFAIFRYGAREFPLAVLLASSLAASLLPRVSANPEQGLLHIREQTKRLSHWLFPLGMASMLASPLVFPIVFNPDFKESALLFNIFTLLLSGRILMPQVVAMSRRHNLVLTLSALLEMLSLLSLSWWWGRLFGLPGIAFASVAAFLVDRLILLWYNWKVLGVAPQRYIDLRTYLFYNILLLAAFFLSWNLF
jgi:hypothetical protein